MKRLHFVVTGRVQGVGFRYYCQEQAEKLGLTGYARNMTDGSVEIEVEGESGRIEEFANAIARGPRAAKVENVVRDAREVKGDRSFRIG